MVHGVYFDDPDPAPQASRPVGWRARLSSRVQEAPRSAAGSRCPLTRSVWARSIDGDGDGDGDGLLHGRPPQRWVVRRRRLVAVDDAHGDASRRDAPLQHRQRDEGEEERRRRRVYLEVLRTEAGRESESKPGWASRREQSLRQGGSPRTPVPPFSACAEGSSRRRGRTRWHSRARGRRIRRRPDHHHENADEPILD